MLIEIINIWKRFFFEKKYLLEFISTVLFSLLFSYFFREFLEYVENWTHWYVLKDPFFLEQAIDLSIPIFIMTYGTIGFFIFYHLKNPIKLMHLIQITIILLFLRVITLYFIRLDADPSMIPLKDPILNTFVYQINQSGNFNQHDLFFSGHTANLFIASVLHNKKKYKYFFLFITFLVGLFLILQKAHYSVDVIFAPLFALMALFLHKKFLNLK